MRDSRQLEEQLVELQSQLAFQDDTINSLNEAVAAQQQEIIVLRQQLTLLKQRLDEQGERLAHGGGGDSASPADEKPPHY